MPIIIPDGLPARDDLICADRIKAMERSRAVHQDIRAQEYAVLNLMPSDVKKRTERQLARLLGHTSLHVHLTLLRTASDQKALQDEHLEAFYKPWEEVSDRQFDGLIVTGAPLEKLDWEEVRYWDELRRIIDWSRKNVTARIHICWGAQAALMHNHGIDKRMLPEKAFGVFPHAVTDPSSPLVTGFDDEFMVPVSRHTEVTREDVAANGHLSIVSESPDTGLYIVTDANGRDIYLMNHPEYGKSSLDGEYRRDVARGEPVRVPTNYYRENDPEHPPVNRWRAHARLLYANLLDYVYQHTPYDTRDIRVLPERLPSEEHSETIAA